MTLEQLLQVARGEQPADLVLRGGTLVNVFTSELYETDVAIAHGCVAGEREGQGPGRARQLGAVVADQRDLHIRGADVHAERPSHARILAWRAGTGIVRASNGSIS